MRQEIAWGMYAIGDEVEGLSCRMVEDYVRYLGNLRAKSIGLGTLYEGYEQEPSSMRWVSQYADPNFVKTDFIEGRSTRTPRVRHLLMTFDGSISCTNIYTKDAIWRAFCYMKGIGAKLDKDF